MSANRVAGRYAKSIIDLAVEQGKLATIVGDMQVLSNAVKNRDLYLMLKSPIIHADKKESIMTEIFGSRFDQMTMAFIKICIAKGREDILPEIATECLAEHKRMQGITTVKITTATPLSIEALEEIKVKLTGSTTTAKSVDIETAVDPNLIGGYVVEYGDKLYDASVAAKLAELKKQFSGNEYVSQIEKK
ncbi:MAG: ATP synthase F1 subunit delta [Saprospiraceae bacterium]|nr:ATP synthase F1 subunit delta [Saprospiraceae bacterium]